MSESFKATHDYPDISERFDSDRYGHFQHVPPPSGELTREAMAWHSRILSAQNEAMYADTNPG